MLSNYHRIYIKQCFLTNRTFLVIRHYLLRVSNMHGCPRQLLQSLPGFSVLLAFIPLQLLACHIAVLRGCDVDKPRKLAKSVTVE
jgi:hypothetical protein